MVILLLLMVPLCAIETQLFDNQGHTVRLRQAQSDFQPVKKFNNVKV